MRRTRSLDRAYFETLYRADPDPWRFATSDYEAAKYARTLSVVAEERVSRALEMGCSIGVFTQRLAALCEEVVATELSPTALAQARRRCEDLANVRFVLARDVSEGIEGPFDLMVLSEVVYYWDDDDLAAIAEAIGRALTPGGRLLLVHWLGETDYPRSADDAVSALRERVGPYTRVVLETRTEDYRLDLWRRLPAVSPPRREGRIGGQMMR